MKTTLDWQTSTDVRAMMRVLAPLVSRQALVRAACACARLALPLVAAGEDRPRMTAAGICRVRSSMMRPDP